ncbi:hypothetical protein [Aureimonas sp. AU40]|uniref:hypothetical protein n=1 Tax=Aureimonas sp. AU40 TaxID=1637747 RepID=UPI0007806CCF|nr:hypothetical protein [Aureimonas sp. AU40]
MRVAGAALAILAGTVPALAEELSDEMLRQLFLPYQVMRLCNADKFSITDGMVEESRRKVVDAQQRLFANFSQEQRQKIWAETARTSQTEYAKEKSPKERCAEFAQSLIDRRLVSEELPAAIGELPQ